MFMHSTWFWSVTAVCRIIARAAYSLSLSAVVPRVKQLLSGVASGCCASYRVSGRCLSRVSACWAADGIRNLVVLGVVGVVRVGSRGVGWRRHGLVQARKVPIAYAIALRARHPASVTHVAIRILSASRRPPALPLHLVGFELPSAGFLDLRLCCFSSLVVCLSSFLEALSLKGVDEQTIVEKNLRKNMDGLPSLCRWVSTHVLECLGVFGRR